MNEATSTCWMRRRWVCWLALALAPTVLAQDPQPPSGGAEAGQHGVRPSATAEPTGEADAAGKRLPDLSSPRAAMKEFLVAVQDSLGDHPERIDDAVACLDTSGLSGEDRGERARQLAQRLYALIDQQGVKLDDIPVEHTEAVFVFHRIAEPGETGPEIQLARDGDTGTWRFTASTVASIPALEEAAKEKQETSEESQEIASEVPAARRTARATMATFLTAMNADPPDLDEAVQCLDPTGQDPAAWKVRGRDLASMLKNVMDKTKVVVLNEVPDDPLAEPYFWHQSKTGNIVIARIEESQGPKEADAGVPDLKGEWRFTAQTLKTLDELYAEKEQEEIVPELREFGVEERLPLSMRLQKHLPVWLRTEVWRLQGWQWLVLAALLPIGWLIKVVGSGTASLLLGTWLRRRRIELAPEVRRRAFRTSGAVLTALFWFYAVQHLKLPPEALSVLLPATKLVLALTAVWVGYRLVDILGGHVAASPEVRLTRFDDVLIPMLQKILRVLVLLVVVVFALEWMGYEWKTLVGALGIGGLALAFAAQDTLGNFFGSITVLFDRPFGIGDWVVIGDVEGTIERVGFRSTRIRTFYHSMVTVPNSKLAVTNIDNYGARRYRRAKILLSLTYSTPPEKVDAFCEGVRELIRLHPYTRKDYYHVYFNRFGPSSLDVLLYTFFEVPDWSTELRERHKLFLDILRLAQRLGVEFAFPTRTVWLERARDGAKRSGEEEVAPAPSDADAVGLSEAARLFEEVYGPEPSPPAPVVIERSPRSRQAGK